MDHLTARALLLINDYFESNGRKHADLRAAIRLRPGWQFIRQLEKTSAYEMLIEYYDDRITNLDHNSRTV